jgi:hypothetical protein
VSNDARQKPTLDYSSPGRAERGPAWEPPEFPMLGVILLVVVALIFVALL